jgi:hypothetical protein
MSSARMTAHGGPLSVLPGRLTYLVEQLWGPALEHPGARVELSSSSQDPAWVTVESYFVLPQLARATLLIPDTPRAATVGALLNFRGLRRTATNVQRTILGNAARTGAFPFPHLRLQRRRDGPAPTFPLAAVADALGKAEVWASIGINMSANRKTTLQLVDADGSPLGFAKFAWEPVSDAAVRTEAQALEAVGGKHGPARAPALLATGTYYDHPFIVSEALPPDSVGVRSRVAPPSAAELYSILPLSRKARVAETAQYAALRTRLAALPLRPENTQVLEATEGLLDALHQRDAVVPVQSRWHGDLAAWNTARSADGTLWLWDWESSEVDAVAGLDPLHWFMSAGMEAGRRWNGASLVSALRSSGHLMTAAGTARSSRAEVTAVYAATIAERACTLAAGAGGWGADWVMPTDLLDLVQTARGMLSSEPNW